MGKEKLTIWEVHPLRSGREAPVRAGAKTNLSNTYRPALGISPDGRWLARGTETCTVQVMETEGMRVVNEFTGHRNLINDLEWLGPGTLATASFDGTVRIWDVAADRELRLLETGGFFWGIFYSPAPGPPAGWASDDLCLSLS